MLILLTLGKSVSHTGTSFIWTLRLHFLQ